MNSPDSALAAPKTAEVAKTEAPKKPVTIRDLLNSDGIKAQIARALPQHVTPDRFLRAALTCMTKTPKLAECDQSSFFSALLTLSQLGIEPDGRRAHLIPFKNNSKQIVECQLIIDWKGLAELAMRSGLVSKLHADVVREGDLFEYSAGDLTKHVPWFLRRDADKPESEGKVLAAYALASFKDGTSKCEVLSMSEVNGIRNRSRAGQSGPWVTDFNEMAKKTAFRRLSKWLTLSPEFREAVEVDNNTDSVIDVTPTKSSLASLEIPIAAAVEEIATTETATPATT